MLALVDGVWRNIGVSLELDMTTPPHWVQEYYCTEYRDGTKYESEDGFVCSCCGKKSYVKKAVCDGCDSVMTIEKGGAE